MLFILNSITGDNRVLNKRSELLINGGTKIVIWLKMFIISTYSN